MPAEAMSAKNDEADACDVKSTVCENTNLSFLSPGRSLLMTCVPCRDALMDLIGTEEEWEEE